MSSHRIESVLEQLLASRKLTSDREFAVMAALKMSRSEYRGQSVNQVLTDIATGSQQTLRQLARNIHPVLCTLDLHKWLGDDGEYAYVVEASHGRGQEATTLAFDDKGSEIPVNDTSQLFG
jgi:SOS response regulatory protein OraA/RecX